MLFERVGKVNDCLLLRESDSNNNFPNKFTTTTLKYNLIIKSRKINIESVVLDNNFICLHPLHHTIISYLGQTPTDLTSNTRLVSLRLRFLRPVIKSKNHIVLETLHDLSSPSRFAYSINSRPNKSSRLKRLLGLPSHMHTMRDESHDSIGLLNEFHKEYILKFIQPVKRNPSMLKLKRFLWLNFPAENLSIDRHKIIWRLKAKAKGQKPPITIN
ncbi:hypothetical protein BpHYR1_014020 [Brachionus plicatilis]|uniref:Uncharacterized protein n=1 Tax=Brachionus plicatilis TaxID=10195 RepID=A0A3M7PR64_BRAPC|nr:hypothetical protein BpHYR1_014020 [Brachionus plicatilis]